jgi:glutaryl-CoA dehydrogenase
VVWARDEQGNVGGHLVEPASTPGYEATVIEGKGSARAVWQAEIRLDAARVPAANRLPGANSFKDTARVLAATRSTCAWAALGHAVAGYDTALTYAKQREQFGRPLCSFQIVQDRLVKMLAEVTAMQLYCLQLGRLAEAGGSRTPSPAWPSSTTRARRVRSWPTRVTCSAATGSCSRTT